MIERLIRLLPLAALTICMPGCIWPFAQSAKINAPVIFEAPPSAVQLAEAVNANSNRVHQLQSQVKVSLEGAPGLTGNLALEKPSRLRLQASLLGVSGLGADVGSNDEFFWVWIKAALPGQSPTMLYARHAEFAVSPTRQQIPIDPALVRDALGLTEINPYGEIEGPFGRPDGQLEIRTKSNSPSGQQTRITVVDPQYAWVTEQSLFDNYGRLIVTAKSSRHRYYPEADVSLPHRVEITLFPGAPESQSMTLDLNGYNINRLPGNPERLWTMPQPSGVEFIDLAAPPPPGYSVGAVDPSRGQPGNTTRMHGHANAPQPYSARDQGRPNDQAYRPDYRGRDLR